MTTFTPSPKPERAPPRKRNELKKISAKKLATLNGKMPFSSISSSTASRKGVVKINRRRKPSEFARIYGSKQRVAWVKQQLCTCTFAAYAPGANCGGPMDNAHAATGGTGRKADYRHIVPLCRTHHRTLHQFGARTFENDNLVSLVAAAAQTQSRWLLHCGKNSLNPETGKPQKLAPEGRD